MTVTTEDQIKDRYILLRKRFHPYYRPSDAKTGNHWDLAAEIVRDLGADPATFVDAQFDAHSARDNNNFPWPANLHDKNAADNYRSFIARNRPTCEAVLQTEIDSLAARLAGRPLNDDNLDEALADPHLPFKSWFRILMCSDKNFPHFKAVWGTYATRQMMNDQALFSYLKVQYAPRIGRFL